jgi:hypothetical protein
MWKVATCCFCSTSHGVKGLASRGQPDKLEPILSRNGGYLMKTLAPYFKHLSSTLFNLQPWYLLFNGNIEKVLKALFANYLDSRAGWSYVMDKRFNRREVDLLVFRNGRAQFTAEFKCTFAVDRSLTKRSAVNAVEQGIGNLGLEVFQPGLDKADAFIIHFLNRTDPKSAESLNPIWIKERFPQEPCPVTASELEGIYEENLSRKGAKHYITTFPIIADAPGKKGCALDAVVARLPWRANRGGLGTEVHAPGPRRAMG